MNLKKPFRYLKSKLQPQGFDQWWKFCAVMAVGMPCLLEIAEGRGGIIWVLAVLGIYSKGKKIYRRRKENGVREMGERQ